DLFIKYGAPVGDLVNSTNTARGVREEPCTAADIVLSSYDERNIKGLDTRWAVFKRLKQLGAVVSNQAHLWKYTYGAICGFYHELVREILKDPDFGHGIREYSIAVLVARAG